jgi:hypothetical protein
MVLIFGGQADRYGFASEKNVMHYFKEHMSTRKALKKTSYNCYILGMGEFSLKKGVNVIMTMMPGKCRRFKKLLASATQKETRLVESIPTLMSIQNTTPRSCPFSVRKMCYVANTQTEDDMKTTLQYLFVMNLLKKCWGGCGKMFSLKMSHMTTMAPMYGPYPLSEGGENYREDFMAINTGLNSLLVKTKTATYFDAGC